MSEERRTRATHTPRTLAALASCPRRFQIEYLDNYRLKGRRPEPWPPSIKVVLRDALRERDVAAVRGLSRLRTDAASYAVILAYRKELTRLIGDLPPREAQRYTGEIAAMSDEAMRVLEHYDEEHPEPLRFVCDEHGHHFVDKLVDIELANKKVLTNRVDGIIARENLPPAVLVRHFTSHTDPQEVIRDLEVDLRLIAAMHAASHLLGSSVTSAVVDVVRTKAPSIPETIQCRKCGGQGGHEKGKQEEDGTWTATTCEACRGTGIGGMSRKPCDTTLKTWQRTVAAHGLDPAAENERCREIVERLGTRSDSFAYRVVVDAAKEAVASWVLDVTEISRLEDYYLKRQLWPRNAAACMGRSGPCPYRKVCSHHGDDDVAWFTRVDEPYPGLG